MSIIQRFFDPIKDMTDNRKINYEVINQVVTTLIALSKVVNQSLYIIDYNRKKFSYVSSHPLFLCGYNSDQVRDWGYCYYEKVVPQEDIEMLLEINKKGFEFFDKLSLEERTQCFISYDFKLKNKKGDIFLINHRLTPLYLTEEGDMWLALCIVTLSTNDQSGNVYIQMLNEPIRYSYSFKSKKFVQIQTVTLSEREKHILRLVAQGFSAQEIACTLFIDINTVKYHKSKIFEKLDVKNMTEAIYYAISNNIV